jgi:hypothetical protein
MAAVDNFAGSYAAGRATLHGPLTNIVTVTPHDTNELAFVTRALYIGGAGNVRLVTPEGDDVTLTALAVGVWHPIRCKIVKVSTTTATLILAGQ